MTADLAENTRRMLLLAALMTGLAGTALPAAAQDTPQDEGAAETPSESVTTDDDTVPSLTLSAANAPVISEIPAEGAAKGQVTSLPLPRFVMLKSDEGNARRGPGLTHRIDWVFKRAGMPLRVTAEYENWRKVEDMEGLGGWMHYSMLSGVRSAIVIAEMADLRGAPTPDAEVVLRAERGVIGRVQQCMPDWCRLSMGGDRGWVSKAAIWGVEPGEIIE